MALPPSDIIRRIRNLIPDTDAIYGANEDQYLFDDTSIGDFYTDGNENVKWAAGLGKITVGGSEALILKVLKNYETQTDGATLMKRWTEAGRGMIDEAKQDIIDSTDGDYFDIAYFGSDLAFTAEGIQGWPQPAGWGAGSYGSLD
jgi:hypothetical protein